MIQDFETEMMILSGMLNSEKLLYEGLTAFIPDHFQDTDHQTIFSEIIRQSEQGAPTFKIIYKLLRGKVNPDKLLALNQNTTPEKSFGYWSQKLQETYVRRSYLTAAKEIAAVAQSDRPIAEITELVEQRILKVNVQESTEQIISPEEAGQHALQEFEKRVKSDKRIHGVGLSRSIATGGIPSTDGFPSLDDMFRGLRGGDLIVIAARTGDGKTALAQNIVRLASIHQQYRTFYQNTEMNPDELVFRFVAQMSGKSFEGIDGGSLNSFDQTIVRQAFENFSQSRIYLSHLPTLSPERSRGLARQFKLEYGQMDLLVIDYIGRMELQNSKNKQEWQVLRDIAKESKRLAAEINACVILISQLTEEGRLQGARAIANEADGVLYLEPKEKSEVNFAPPGATHKLVPFKARRGAKDKKIWIGFNKHKMYMTEVR